MARICNPNQIASTLLNRRFLLIPFIFTYCWRGFFFVNGITSVEVVILDYSIKQSNNNFEAFHKATKKIC